MDIELEGIRSEERESTIKTMVCSEIFCEPKSTKALNECTETIGYTHPKGDRVRCFQLRPDVLNTYIVAQR